MRPYNLWMREQVTVPSFLSHLSREPQVHRD